MSSIVIRGALLVCVLCVLGATPASAQSGNNSTTTLPKPLDIQVVLGFSNTFRLGAWTPLTVIVTNHNQNVIGEVEVQISRGNDLEGSVFTTTYLQTFSLTENARKRFRFTVLLDNASKPLVVRVTSAGQEIARRTLDLRRQFTEGHLIVVLSRDADLDYLNDSTGEQLRVVYPHPELLPTKWQGYDGVSALVLHGQSLERLSIHQHEALRVWLTQGGKLIVSGSADYSLLRTPRLAALLPAKPVGLVSMVDGAALGEVLGMSLSTNRPFAINQIANLRGSIIYQVHDVPLVVMRDHGMGQVFYFTFDIAAYPFDRWSGMTHLWTKTFLLSEFNWEVHSPDHDFGNPIPNMLDGPNRGFPNHLTVFSFLVVYLGMLIIAYQSHPKTSRMVRLNTGLVWLGPIIVAPVAYFLFGPLLYPLGTTALSVITIEPFPRGGYAHVNLAVGFYSNKRRWIQWQYENLAPVLTPMVRVHDEGYKTPEWRIHDGHRSSVMVDESTPYVLHQITGKDIIRYDLRAHARDTDAGLLLNVRNQTGQELQTAGLVFDNALYAVPTVSIDSIEQDSIPLQSQLFSLDKPNWPATLNSVGDLSRHLRHTVAFAIEKQVSKFVENTLSDRNQALLVALSSTPIIKSRFDALVAHHEVFLVLVRVPVSRSEHSWRAGRHSP